MIDLIEPTDTLLTGYYWDCVYNSGISVLLRIGPVCRFCYIQHFGKV